jgi:hypothetical protein
MRVASAQTIERPKTDKSSKTITKEKEVVPEVVAPTIVIPTEVIKITEVKLSTPKPARPRDKLARLEHSMASTFYENE